MAQDSGKNQQSLTTVPTAVPTTIPLGPSTTLDLSSLPEDQRKALLMEHARGIIDINRKAQELHVDVAVLKAALTTLADTVQTVSESGTAVTASHTQTTSIGRTEIRMGNTEEDKKGKLTKSQTGERDWTPIYIIGGLIAVVLIAALLGR